MAGTWNDIAREYRRASSIKRIGRHVAWERITQPKPVDLTEVPPSPEALTKEYLTAVLCGEHPGAEVMSIILGEESSGSGNRCAIELGYNEIGERAGLPKYLFHKCEKDFYLRLHLRRLEIDQNEPKFYSVIQPEVNIETPKAYLAAFDERSCRLSLLMEDVSREQGAVFFEVNSQVSRSDIEQMLSILAGLHAKYWGSERLDQEFTWLMNPARFSQKLIEGMELEQLTSNGLERAVSVLPASLAGRKDDIWNAFLAAMEISSRAVQTMADRHQRRLSSTAEERQGSYNANTPRLEDILKYLNDFPLDDLPGDALTLMQLLLSSVEVSLSIEVFDPEKEQLHAKDAASIEISHELDDF